jgi:hypothetical protein
MPPVIQRVATLALFVALAIAQYGIGTLASRWQFRVARWRSQGRDETEHEHDNYCDVVDDIGRRAWTNTDGDREHSHQGPKERESLSSQTGPAARSWADPRERETCEKHCGDHAFRDASLPMLVAVDEQAGMDERRSDESSGLEEHEELNRSRHTSVHMERPGKRADRVILQILSGRIHLCHWIARGDRFAVLTLIETKGLLLFTDPQGDDQVREPIQQP